MDDANRLTITLLGQFGVWRGSQPVKGFRADPVRALLAYLAVHQGTPQRRETLAALLSPDRSDKDARTYLRKQIARLRKAFGSEDADRFLQIEYKSVMLLKDEAVTVDFVQFSTRLAAVRQHRHRRIESCPACLGRIGEAVALYQGELMQGLTFKSDLWEAWLLSEREKVGRQAQEALTTLTKWKVESGQWKESLALAQRVLELEAWHEGAHRWAMEAHWQLGDRNAALAQFERCQTVLWDELGVEPEEETRKLVERLEQEGGMGLGAGGWEEDVGVHNLPSVATPFFGRKQRLTELQDTLTNPANRLVTLLGEGGVGKSRLAIETGHRLLGSFPDGVWFVPLVAVDPADGQEAIVTAIAQALSFNFSGKRQPLDQLVNFLREAESLIILDQMEHVLDSAELILTLLQRTRSLAILNTSRIVLGFMEEMVIPLGGLHLDAQLDADDPAVALFADRAQRVSGWQFVPSALPDVAQIVTLVDGNSLALELAASWTRALAVDKIAPHIQKSADFLATRNRSLPARHRSMRAVFETSWQLLEQAAQRLYGKLSIFRGGFTLEAAEAIVEASLWELDELIEQSLLQRYGDRYVVHELLRVFSAEKQPPDHRLQTNYANYYVQRLTRSRPKLLGAEPLVAKRAIRSDEINIRQAWQWASDIDKRAYIEAFGTFFYQEGRLQEAMAYFNQLLAETNVSSPQIDAIRSELKVQQVRFFVLQGRFQEGLKSAEEATQLAYRTEEADTLARVLCYYSEALIGCGNYVEACKAAAQGLEMQPQSVTQATLLNALGVATYRGTNDLPSARRYLTEALAICRSNQHLSIEASVHIGLGHCWFAEHQHQLAKQHFYAAKQRYLALEDPLGINLVLSGLANIAGREDTPYEALALHQEGLAISEKRGWLSDAARFNYNLGFAYLQLGAFDKAQQHLEKAWQFIEKDNDSYWRSLCCLAFGLLYRLQQQFNVAQHWYAQALQPDQLSQQQLLADYAHDGLGHVAVELGQWEQADTHFRQALTHRTTAGQTILKCETEAGLLHLRTQQGRRKQLPALLDQIWDTIERVPSLNGCEVPFAIYLACYNAALLLDDTTRATAVLNVAHDKLTRKANQLTDEAIRHAFLHNLPHHREILEIWNRR